MGLETFTFVSSFNTSWPDGATDVKGQGDNHLRGIKSALAATFPNASAAFYFPSTQSKTSAHTVVAADQNKIILCDATGGAFTLTLTAAATLGSRFRFTAIKIDSSANAITVDGNASETINGATTFSIGKQYQSTTFVCDGSTWYVEQGNTASATVAGEVELATTTEVLTGTDATRAVTPDALAALWEQGSNITAAATISVGEGGYFTVTGNTGISDIDFATDKAGRGAWLRFTGTPLLTHSSTLPLPNSANYQVVAGDMMYVVSEGSDTVRVLNIMRVTGFPVYPTLVASTTDNAAIRADGTSGNTQNSAFIIDDTGHVTSFGGNITFPGTQATNAGANVLDDYEEGTATISFTAVGTPPTGVTYTSQTLTYTKIGREVCMRGRLILSNKGSGGVGQVEITGLPFSLPGNQIVNCRGYGAVTLPSSGVGMYGTTSTTVMDMSTETNAGSAGITWADVNNTFSFFFNATCHTTS